MCSGKYRCFPRGANGDISSNWFLSLLHRVEHLVKTSDCWLIISQSITIYDLFRNLIVDGDIELYKENCDLFTWPFQDRVHIFFVGQPFWGLENEALIVRCPQSAGSLYPVEWYHSNTNESIPTQKRSRIFVLRDRLKFLPARVDDSGMYACVIRRYCTGNSDEPWLCSLFTNDGWPSCHCFLSALPPTSGMVKFIKWFEQGSVPEKTAAWWMIGYGMYHSKDIYIS